MSRAASGISAWHVSACHSHGVHREAYLSAQCPSPSQEARFSRTDEYSSWPGSTQVAPRQGSRSTLRLIDRIRTRGEFIRLRRDGRRLRIDPLWCTHVLDPSTAAVHVAFAINRSVGNAVTRNQLRRRMRSLLSEMDLPDGLYLFGCRPSAAELTFDEIAALLGKLPARLQ
jgi:ribonuclease P protein component